MYLVRGKNLFKVREVIKSKNKIGRGSILDLEGRGWTEVKKGDKVYNKKPIRW